MSTITSTSTKTLTLWTSSLKMLFTLPGWVGLGDLANLPDAIEPGNHIIIKDGTTSEAFVLRAIYRILEAGSNPQIYCSKFFTDYLVQDPLQNATQLLQQYTEYSIYYRDYLNSLKNTEMDIEVASEVAAVILEYSKSPSLELEILRERVKVNSFIWNKIVKEIEQALSQQQKANVNNTRSGGIVGNDRQLSADSYNQDSVRFTATVSSVIEILNLGLTDYEEQQLLEAVCKESGLSKSVFWKLVSSQKYKIDALQPGDEIRLNNLINWHDNKLDFDKALPCMAADIKHDADIKAIDPIMIWQVLFPAVLSQIGTKIKLDVGSHTIPCIAYTLTVAESGTGKSRADDLVLSPLRDLQIQYRKQYEYDLEEWEKTCTELKGERKPKKPVERKAIYEIATIQAVLRRSSEQEAGGQLWSRDEIAGLFKSLSQFGKGENEGLECILKVWDGSYTQVDRVHQEDSYSTNKISISLNGGIQPGVYRQIFKDANDAQGLTARFLIANVPYKEPKRVSGYCCLTEKLPLLYSWLRQLQPGTIKTSKAANALYDKLYDQIAKQISETSQPAVRAWLLKLMGSNLLRIALALHFIECYHDRNKPIWELQKDTLERAILFAQYYRSAFQIVHEITTDSDDIASILLKIWDAAVTKHPDGISTRDAYRNINAIKYRAKDAGRDTSSFTVELFEILEAKGKGKVTKNGRTIKFVANLGGEPPQSDFTPPPSPEPTYPTQDKQEPQITPNLVQVESEKVTLDEEVKVEEEINNFNINDKLTVAKTLTSDESEVSVQNQVSVPTVKNSSSYGSNVVVPVSVYRDAAKNTDTKNDVWAGVPTNINRDIGLGIPNEPIYGF